MKKLVLTLMLISCYSLIGQISATIDEDGRSVILNSDGTWEYKQINSLPEISDSPVDIYVRADLVIDPLDGSKKAESEIWTGFGKGGTGQLSAQAWATESVIGIRITYTDGIGCLSKYSSSMKVKLSNDEVIDMSMLSDTDCGDYPTGIFIPISKDELSSPNWEEIITNNTKSLRDNKWVLIRLTGSEYYSDITPFKTKKIVNPEQFFTQHITAVEKAMNSQ